MRNIKQAFSLNDVVIYYLLDYRKCHGNIEMDRLEYEREKQMEYLHLCMLHRSNYRFLGNDIVCDHMLITFGGFLYESALKLGKSGQESEDFRDVYDGLDRRYKDYLGKYGKAGLEELVAFLNNISILKQLENLQENGSVLLKNDSVLLKNGSVLLKKAYSNLSGSRAKSLPIDDINTFSEEFLNLAGIFSITARFLLIDYANQNKVSIWPEMKAFPQIMGDYNMTIPYMNNVLSFVDSLRESKDKSIVDGRELPSSDVLDYGERVFNLEYDGKNFIHPYRYAYKAGFITFEAVTSEINHIGKNNYRHDMKKVSWPINSPGKEYVPRTKEYVEPFLAMRKRYDDFWSQFKDEGLIQLVDFLNMLNDDSRFDVDGELKRIYDSIPKKDGITIDKFVEMFLNLAGIYSPKARHVLAGYSADFGTTIYPEMAEVFPLFKDEHLKEKKV